MPGLKDADLFVRSWGSRVKPQRLRSYRGSTKQTEWAKGVGQKGIGPVIEASRALPRLLDPNTAQELRSSDRPMAASELGFLSSRRVWDNDGEFLLIEAALALPKWLKPDTARNRVWLRGGSLHVVPLPSAKHPTLPPAPSVAEALAVVAADAVDTLGSSGVQVGSDTLQRVCGSEAAMLHHPRATMLTVRHWHCPPHSMLVSNQPC